MLIRWNVPFSGWFLLFHQLTALSMELAVPSDPAATLLPGVLQHEQFGTSLVQLFDAICQHPDLQQELAEHLNDIQKALSRPQSNHIVPNAVVA